MDYTEEEILEMLKALSNNTRLQIMCWLSEPDRAFRGLTQHEGNGIPDWGGACVGTIQEKAGLSQSVISSYLKSMHQAGLLEMRRHEKWTYYRVNRGAVRALAGFIAGWEQ